MFQYHNVLRNENAISRAVGLFVNMPPDKLSHILLGIAKSIFLKNALTQGKYQ